MPKISTLSRTGSRFNPAAVNGKRCDGRSGRNLAIGVGVGAEPDASGAPPNWWIAGITRGIGEVPDGGATADCTGGTEPVGAADG